MRRIARASPANRAGHCRARELRRSGAHIFMAFQSRSQSDLKAAHRFGGDSALDQLQARNGTQAPQWRRIPHPGTDLLTRRGRGVSPAVVVATGAPAVTLGAKQ
jgi:hypothetical protein